MVSEFLLLGRKSEIYHDIQAFWSYLQFKLSQEQFG